MNQKKVIIAASIISLLAALFFLLYFAVISNNYLEQISLSSTGGDSSSSQLIRCYTSDSDTGYYFLPAGNSSLHWQLNTSYEVYIDDVRIKDGQACTLEKDIPFRLDVRTSLGNILASHTVTIKQSENLSALFIDTDSGKMDYIHSDKNHKESGTYTFMRSDGSTEESGSIAFLKGRGNYSWLQEKKCYTLSLAEAASPDGLPTGHNWILLANASEDTHLINALMFMLAEKIGIQWSPDFTFVDLYLNGSYAGNYLLCEKIEASDERIPLSGDEWMIERDGYCLTEEGAIHFTTTGGETFAIHWPEEASDKQQSEIAAYIQTVEDSINTPLDNTYKELVDFDSLVLKYIIDEISLCPDAWNGSNFCYYDSTQNKLVFGIPWDYEFSLGNTPSWFSYLQDPYQFYHIHDTPWYKRLYEREDFLTSVKQSYRNIVLPSLKTLQSTWLSATANRIAPSMELDALRWNIDTRSFSKAFERLNHFITNRTDWLADAWSEMTSTLPEYSKLTFIKNGSEYQNYTICSGDSVSPKWFEVEDEHFQGWYYDEAFTQPVDALNLVVTEDMTFYGLWEDNSGFFDIYGILLPLTILLFLLSVMSIKELNQRSFLNFHSKGKAG